MLRTFVVTESMDQQALSSRLLDGRFRGGQSDAALDALKRANPHADLTKLKPGTVLFVPDGPVFKANATASVSAAFFDDFQKQVSDALNEATANLKSGIEARAADRAGVAAFLKSAAFRRILASDEVVKQQADEALGALGDEEEQDKRSAETFDTATRSVAAALAQLGKTIG